VGIAWVGGSILFAVVGVLATRHLMRPHVREGHNDVLVPLFLTAGVIYAVLLAFMVIAMWETYDNADANVNEEASLLAPMYRQAMDFSPEKGVEMRKLIRDYAEEVIAGWDQFSATGNGSAAARISTDRMVYLFGTLTPATKGREIVDSQFMATFSQLIVDRNKRLFEAAASLSWIMWAAAVGGGVITVGMSFVLYMDKPMPQVVMVSVLAALIGILLFFMMMLNKPFQGPLAIRPEAFEAMIKTLDAIEGDFQKFVAEDQSGGATPNAAPSAGASNGEEHAH
jgi:hypothetical protein